MIDQKRVEEILRTGRASLARLPRNRELIQGHFSSANDCFFRFIFSSLLKFSNLCAFDLQIHYGGPRCDFDSKCVIFCIYCCGHVLAHSGSAAEINNQLSLACLQRSSCCRLAWEKKKPKLVFASCKNALPLLITRVVKRKFNYSKADRQADLRLFDAPRNCVFLAKNLTVELGGACRSSFWFWTKADCSSDKKWTLEQLVVVCCCFWVFFGLQLATIWITKSLFVFHVLVLLEIIQVHLNWVDPVE